MWSISIVSLCVVVAICALGLYHSAFKDNVLQCLGMSVIVLFCLGLINRIWEDAYADPSWAGALAGMALYAVGTLVKVTIHHGRERGWSLITDFDRRLLERRTAAGAFDSRPHHHV